MPIRRLYLYGTAAAAITLKVAGFVTVKLPEASTVADVMEYISTVDTTHDRYIIALDSDNYYPVDNFVTDIIPFYNYLQSLDHNECIFLNALTIVGTVFTPVVFEEANLVSQPDAATGTPVVTGRHFFMKILAGTKVHEDYMTVAQDATNTDPAPEEDLELGIPEPGRSFPYNPPIFNSNKVMFYFYNSGSIIDTLAANAVTAQTAETDFANQLSTTYSAVIKRATGNTPSTINTYGGAGGTIATVQPFDYKKLVVVNEDTLATINTEGKQSIEHLLQYTDKGTMFFYATASASDTTLSGFFQTFTGNVTNGYGFIQTQLVSMANKRGATAVKNKILYTGAVTRWLVVLNAEEVLDDEEASFGTPIFRPPPLLPEQFPRYQVVFEGLSITYGQTDQDVNYVGVVDADKFVSGKSDLTEFKTYIETISAANTIIYPDAETFTTAGVAISGSLYEASAATGDSMVLCFLSEGDAYANDGVAGDTGNAGTLPPDRYGAGVNDPLTTAFDDATIISSAMQLRTGITRLHFTDTAPALALAEFPDVAPGDFTEGALVLQPYDYDTLYVFSTEAAPHLRDVAAKIEANFPDGRYNFLYASATDIAAGSGWKLADTVTTATDYVWSRGAILQSVIPAPDVTPDEYVYKSITSATTSTSSTTAMVAGAGGVAALVGLTLLLM